MKSKILKLITLTGALALSACAANHASIKTQTSPVDGSTRTTVTGSGFSTSYIYPADGGGSGIEIAGGTVIDKKYAQITFKAFEISGFRDALFNADGDLIEIETTKHITDFSVSEYGSTSSKTYVMTCDELLKISKSNEVYLRITYSDGFVDYSVSESGRYGADGFAMVKKIAEQCI